MNKSIEKGNFRRKKKEREKMKKTIWFH